MTVSTNVDQGSNAVTISISGRFDFKSHQDFRRAYEQMGSQGVKYVIDLSRAEYMDSSALGMLLMLREYAGGEKAEVEIANASGEIKSILNISNFGKLFSIN